MAKKRKIAGVQFLGANRRKPWRVQKVSAAGKIVSGTFTVEEDAIAWAMELEREKDLAKKGMSVAKGNITFREYAASFIRKRQADPSLAHGTWTTDASRFELYWLTQFGHINLKAITRPMIEDRLARMITEEGLSPATRNRNKALVHTMFEWAIDDGYLVINPAARIPTLSEKKKTRPTGFWELESDMEKYISAAYRESLTVGVFAEIQLFAGPRVSESIALQWRDVDFNRNQILIRRIRERSSGALRDRRKGHEEGDELVIPMFARVKEALLKLRAAQTHVNGSDFVLQNNLATGAPYPYFAFQKIHRRVLKASGVPPITIHDMRRTYATHAEDAGFSRADVQKLLGHASITTTENYIRRRVNTLFEKAQSTGFGKATDSGVVIPMPAKDKKG